MTPEDVLKAHRQHMYTIELWVRDIDYAMPTKPGEFLYWLLRQMETDREEVLNTLQGGECDETILHCLLYEQKIVVELLNVGVTIIAPTDLKKE